MMSCFACQRVAVAEDATGKGGVMVLRWRRVGGGLGVKAPSCSSAWRARTPPPGTGRSFDGLKEVVPGRARRDRAAHVGLDPILKALVQKNKEGVSNSGLRFGRGSNVVFLELQTLLEPFGITRFYTDGWGS